MKFTIQELVLKRRMKNAVCVRVDVSAADHLAAIGAFPIDIRPAVLRKALRGGLILMVRIFSHEGSQGT